MTSRRKGTPCACETDPCRCGSSKGKCVRSVNNVPPDPNGDLIIIGGTGIRIQQIGDALVITNIADPDTFIAGNNIEFNPSGEDISIDLVDEPVIDGLMINGDLEVNGDIIQNGAAYETHAEKVYSRDDYIIMREGAIAALAPGDYSGFQVRLYDGVNDGRLVIDNTGTARVGDVGSEQPLLTRDESADLTNAHLLEWDAANFKAKDSGITAASKQNVTDRQSGTRMFYQQINNKTYLCWGYETINVEYDTRNEITITYPITPDDGSNVFPIVSSLSAPSYFGDCSISVSSRSATEFKVQSIGHFNGMGTVSLPIAWMAVITTA